MSRLFDSMAISLQIRLLFQNRKRYEKCRDPLTTMSGNPCGSTSGFKTVNGMTRILYHSRRQNARKNFSDVHRKNDMQSADASAILRSQGQRSTPTERNP